MNRDRLIKAAVFCVLVALALAVRLLSETPNFSAVAAVTLFAGFYFRHRTTAVGVVLVSMTLSDYVLGGYAKPVMVAVYGSLLIPIAWRSMLRSGLTPMRVGAGTISSSLAFYLLTNGAVWYAWYPHSWTGFVRCFAVAVPFFFNTISGDVVFSAVLFGVYALAFADSKARERAPAAAAAL